MKKCLFVMVLLVGAASASALTLWSDNFESAANTANNTITAHNVADGWAPYTRFGDTHPVNSQELHHLTTEADTSNNGFGVALGAVGDTGTKQLTLGAAGNSSGITMSGGAYTIITGLPIGTTLNLDGYLRSRMSAAGTGTYSTQAEVYISDDITLMPPAYSLPDGKSTPDWNPGTLVRKRSKTQNTSYHNGGPSGNGGSLMSAWSDNLTTYNGNFTTTDGTVLVLLKVSAYGPAAANPFGLWDFDDLTITGIPEPASLILLALGIPMIRRRRLRRA